MVYCRQQSPSSEASRFSKLVKEFSTFYGTRRFITAFTSSLYVHFVSCVFRSVSFRCIFSVWSLQEAPDCRRHLTKAIGVSVRLRLKCDDTLTETSFRLSAKRTSPFKSTGGSQFSRLLAAEVCASAVLMLNTPCSEVV